MSLCLGARRFPSSEWLAMVFFEVLMLDVANCSNASSNPVMALWIFEIFFGFLCFFFSGSSVRFSDLASGSCAGKEKWQKKKTSEEYWWPSWQTEKLLRLVRVNSNEILKPTRDWREIGYVALYTWMSFFITACLSTRSEDRIQHFRSPCNTFLYENKATLCSSAVMQLICKLDIFTQTYGEVSNSHRDVARSLIFTSPGFYRYLILKSFTTVTLRLYFIMFWQLQAHEHFNTTILLTEWWLIKTFKKGEKVIDGMRYWD